METVTEQQAERDPAERTAAGPVWRTAGLEVLTDEHRGHVMPGVDLAGARVVVVLRGRDRVEVTASDADWRHVVSEPTQVLARLLRMLGMYRVQAGAELLMPTPDVLTALGGPAVQLLTAPVHMFAMNVQPGMLLHSTDDDGDGAETLEPVSAVRDCTDRKCIHGTSCVVLTVSGYEDPDPDVHFHGYSSVTVRIPASVTR